MWRKIFVLVEVGSPGYFNCVYYQIRERKQSKAVKVNEHEKVTAEEKHKLKQLGRSVYIKPKKDRMPLKPKKVFNSSCHYTRCRV